MYASFSSYLGSPAVLVFFGVYSAQLASVNSFGGPALALYKYTPQDPGSQSLVFRATRGGTTLLIVGSGHHLPWAEAMFAPAVEEQISQLQPSVAFFENPTPHEFLAPYLEDEIAALKNLGFGDDDKVDPAVLDKSNLPILRDAIINYGFPLDYGMFRDYGLPALLEEYVTMRKGVDASLVRLAKEAQSELVYLESKAEAHGFVEAMAAGKCYLGFAGGKDEYDQLMATHTHTHAQHTNVSSSLSSYH